MGGCPSHSRISDPYTGIPPLDLSSFVGKGGGESVRPFWPKVKRHIRTSVKCIIIAARREEKQEADGYVRH